MRLFKLYYSVVLHTFYTKNSFNYQKSTLKQIVSININSPHFYRSNAVSMSMRRSWHPVGVLKVVHITYINNFIHHISCTDGKISVRISLLFYLFLHRRPIQQLFVSFLSPLKHFQQVLWVLKFLQSPDLGSWQLEFKSVIIAIVGFKILFVGLGCWS